MKNGMVNLICRIIVTERNKTISSTHNRLHLTDTEVLVKDF